MALARATVSGTVKTQSVARSWLLRGIAVARRRAVDCGSVQRAVIPGRRGKRVKPTRCCLSWSALGAPFTPKTARSRKETLRQVRRSSG